MKALKPQTTITSQQLVFNEGTGTVYQPYASSLVKRTHRNKEVWLHVYHLYAYSNLDDALKAVQTFEDEQKNVFTDLRKMLSKMVTKQNKTKKNS